MQQFLMTRRSMLFSLVGLMLTALLTVWGCGGTGSTGSGSYYNPDAVPFTNATATALIEPTTLKTWMDEGKVNAAFTNPNRVVIVAVGSASSYVDGHIPGAIFLDSGTLNLTRTEGATQIGTMVMNGPTIDTTLQRLGINKYTTIVLATSGNDNAMNVSRVYFTLRYWGFPKKQIKVLNGGEVAWKTTFDAASPAWPASYDLATDTPVVQASSFSVKELYNGRDTNNFGLRTSIGEMISLVDQINTDPTGPVASSVILMDERGGINVSNEPYIMNAQKNTSNSLDSHTNYYGTTAGSFKSIEGAGSLKENLAGFGITDGSKTIYVYCASGMRASTAFFVLDGILGWPVKLYDGSWQQWSGYTSLAPSTNKVTAQWQTNVNTSGTSTNRTANASFYVAPRPTTIVSGDDTPIGASLTLDGLGNTYGIIDPRANQMLLEDKAYFTAPVVNTQTGTGGEGSGC